VPAALAEQLVDGGRLVIPVGGIGRQELRRVVRRGDRLDETAHGPASFVPLIGRGGFPEGA